MSASQGTFSRNKNWSRSIPNRSMSSSRSLMLRRRNGNTAAQAAATGASGPNKGSLLSLNKTDGGGRPHQLHLPPTDQQLSPTQLSPQLSFSSIGGGGRARASSTPSRAISLLNLFIPSSASSLSNQSQGFDKPEFAEGSCVDSYLLSFLRKTAVVLSLIPTTIFCLLLCFGSNPTIKQLKNESAFSICIKLFIRKIANTQARKTQKVFERSRQILPQSSTV